MKLGRRILTETEKAERKKKYLDYLNRKFNGNTYHVIQHLKLSITEKTESFEFLKELLNELENEN
jgi:hypothetical protein